MMKRILSLLTCALVIITLFAGCSGAESNSHAGVTVTSGTFPPFFVDSVEEFHNLLLAARAYASDGIMTHGMTDSCGRSLNNAIRNRTFGDMERYYIPSWLPEELTISRIHFSSGIVSFGFDVDGVASDQINFTWWLGANADRLLNEMIGMHGLEPAVGVEGLYYYDFDHGHIRSYHWIQDGYVFRLNIPVRLITRHAHQNDGFGRAGEAPVGDSIAYLVMNSALAVELVDGQPYVPLTGIEINAPEADIEVGETLALTANISPANVTIDAVIWSSSGNSVATVTQDGVVTRVGDGTATITARTVDGNLAATFELGDTDYTAEPEENTVS